MKQDKTSRFANKVLKLKLNKIFLLILVIGILYQLYVYWQGKFYISLVPNDIEVEKINLIDISEINRCGVVIYKISEKGLVNFQLKMQRAFFYKKTKDDYFTSKIIKDSNWNKTPYVENIELNTNLVDRWLSGLSCSNISFDNKKMIEYFIFNSGSYYQSNMKRGFLVIPKLNLLVLIIRD